MMAQDVRTWKSLENSFVFFALSQVQCQCIHLEMIQGHESDIQHLREPRQVQQQEFCVHWNSLLDVQHRIEFCGDSKVVVNWCEAFWPVRNPHFRDLVHDSARHASMVAPWLPAEDETRALVQTHFSRIQFVGGQICWGGNIFDI